MKNQRTIFLLACLTAGIFSLLFIVDFVLPRKEVSASAELLENGRASLFGTRAPSGRMFSERIQKRTNLEALSEKMAMIDKKLDRVIWMMEATGKATAQGLFKKIDVSGEKKIPSDIDEIRHVNSPQVKLVTPFVQLSHPDRKKMLDETSFIKKEPSSHVETASKEKKTPSDIPSGGMISLGKSSNDSIKPVSSNISGDMLGNNSAEDNFERFMDEIFGGSILSRTLKIASDASKEGGYISGDVDNKEDKKERENIETATTPGTEKPSSEKSDTPVTSGKDNKGKESAKLVPTTSSGKQQNSDMQKKALSSYKNSDEKNSKVENINEAPDKALQNNPAVQEEESDSLDEESEILNNDAENGQVFGDIKSQKWLISGSNFPFVEEKNLSPQ